MSATVDSRLAAAADRVNAAIQAGTGGRVGLFVPPLGAVRTSAQQATLYAQGRTSSGPQVTGTLQSKHLTGRALDLAFTLDGKRLDPSSVPLTYWNTLATLMKSALPSVRWGGDWRSRDYGHFEL